MSRAASYTKNIACLESLWNNDLEDRWSVYPILDVFANVQDVKLAHLTCNTEPEFIYNLKMLAKRRSYGILYLAFHGGPGELYLADDTSISLETLSEYMGERFSGRIIHFGCCSTLRVSAQRLADFVESTGVNMILGYTKDIDWIESSAMDLLVFQMLQQYVDLHACWRALQKNYPDLIARTGLSVALG
ncbi:MAG: hypothetical protein DIU80_013955 [Chloroflexota bacterium]|nr:MAG: hypothetical protein DIU80_08450 [Chloroflexota bacterium]